MSRQDIALKDFAASLGFESQVDDKGEWAPGIPNNPYSFSRGNVHVWSCMHQDRPHWVVAKLVGEKYTGHQYDTDLRKILDIASDL